MLPGVYPVIGKKFPKLKVFLMYSIRLARFLPGKAAKSENPASSYSETGFQGCPVEKLRVYPKSARTCCGAMFAWASMAVPAWSRIWFLVNVVISEAISTSRMTDSAA